MDNVLLRYTDYQDTHESRTNKDIVDTLNKKANSKNLENLDSDDDAFSPSEEDKYLNAGLVTSSSTSNGPDDQPTNGNNGPISSNKMMLNALSQHHLGLGNVSSLNGSNHHSLGSNGQLINNGQLGNGLLNSSFASSDIHMLMQQQQLMAQQQLTNGRSNNSTNNSNLSSVGLSINNSPYTHESNLMAPSTQFSPPSNCVSPRPSSSGNLLEMNSTNGYHRTCSPSSSLSGGSTSPNSTICVKSSTNGNPNSSNHIRNASAELLSKKLSGYPLPYDNRKFTNYI